MIFINREKEMEFLKEAKELSKKKLFTLAIWGPRRIGKTRLLLEFMDTRDLYLFVNKNKTSRSLLEEFQNTLKEKNMLSELEELKNWETFFKVIFERFKGTIVFDEFQNFMYVEPSVFGILQKFIDMYEHTSGLLIIFCGSLIGLMKKTFSKKEPLYGRIKRKLRIKPLDFQNVCKMCKHLNIDFENCVKLYAIFGGYPKYYVSIEDEGLEGKSFDEIMERFFFRENAVLEDEVQTILSLEFGKRRGVYYDILSAIANGCRRIGEIASYMRKKQTSITRHLRELVKEFEYIEYETQAVGNKRLLKISHPLINFWMKFFHKNLSLYIKRDEEFLRKVKRSINDYIGKRFEIICRELLPTLLPITFTRIGKQWGKIPSAPVGKNVYEIDIVALNENTKEILFAECKWKSRVNAKKVVKELAEKARYVEWFNEQRKESYAVFAKNFSKRIDKFEGKRVYCFDLKDLERMLKRKY